MIRDQLGQARQQRIADLANDEAVDVEVNAIVEHDLVAHDAHLIFIGATVGVGIAIDGLGLVRAQIAGIGDPVLVVVVLGAAVRVFEAVFVFGHVGTMVDLVGNSVQVVVFFRATVFVAKAVFVFGHVGTLVSVVENAIVVAVAIRVETGTEVVHRVHADQDDVRVFGAHL